MPTVRTTTHLVRFFPGLPAAEGVELSGTTVAAVMDALNTAFPGIDHYLRDEGGTLRKHVVIFVDGEAIVDRASLSDPVGADSEVYVAQALSGG